METPQVRRRLRQPSVKFNLQTEPYAIAPFFIHPVRPGETMTNLLLQSRVVSDPINNALIGWWKEYYFFYVPLMGMPNMAATMRNLFVNPATDVSALRRSSNSPSYYSFKSGINYVQECLEVVVEEFFRDEGESYDLALTTNGYPKAVMDPPGRETWAESLKLASAGADDMELPGVDEIEELDILTGFTSHYAQWELMRDMNVIDVTYEDYLRSQGVDVPASAIDTGSPQLDYKPEALRYVREWTYPTNHVNPADGVPSSATSWSIAERADKKRFFKHPGFIFGVTVTRPKTYFGNQKGTEVGMLDSPYQWLPDLLAGREYTGLKEHTFSATDGILQNQAANYWTDAADIFAHGGQFINYTPTVAATHAVALPSTTMEKRFVPNADITSMFKTAGVEKIREDGTVSLNILSRIRETT